MDMIKSRNLTSHTYNQNVADDIVVKIRNTYFHQIKEFLLKCMNSHQKDEILLSSLKFGLTLETVKSINSIFLRHPGIEKVILYGSRAMGNFKPGSDIDLTIKGDLIDTSDLLRIENELEDLMLVYKIDLSLIHQIENQSLIEHISRVGQVFFEQATEPKAAK